MVAEPKKTSDENGSYLLAKAVLDQIEHAGVPGVADARHSNAVKRVIYSAIIVVFFVCAVIHTAITLRKALKNATSTSVSVDYTDNIDLPDITICNRYSDFINETKLAENYFKRFPIDNSSSTENPDQRLSDDEIDLQEWVALSWVINRANGPKQKITMNRARIILNRSFAYPEVLERLQQRLKGVSLANAYRAAVDRYIIKCEELFLSCQIQGTFYDCCSAGLTTMILSAIGPCWVVSTSKVKERPENSERGENSIVIALKKWADPTPGRFEKDVQKDVIIPLPPIVVRLGTGQWVPGGGNAYHVYPGVYTSFGLTAKQIIDIPIRGSCETNAAKMLQFFESYSSEHCSAENAMLDANEKSDCKIDLLEVFDPNVFSADSAENSLNRPYCPQFIKINATNFKPTPFPIKRSTKKDLDECPNLCNRFDYSYSIVRDVPQFVLHNAITSLFFRFTDERYMIYEQVETLAWYDYLSLIGGIWGIWIGSSLVTLMQVSEIPIWLCFWRKKSVVTSTEAELRENNVFRTN